MGFDLMCCDFPLTFLVVAAGFSVNGCNLPARTSSPEGASPELTMQEASPAGIYEEMRSAAINVKPEDLKLDFSEDKNVVYGVVMDWDMPEGVATTIAFSTGDASLYTSRGGGVIGGVGHQAVRTSAMNAVEKANLFLKWAHFSKDSPIPSKDCVRFYFLTNKGLYTYEEKMARLEDQTSPWFPMFEEINKVITELTIIDGAAYR